MITLVPFYRDLQMGQEGRQLLENAKIFDYRRALTAMINSFAVTNPNNDYIISTDDLTSLPDFDEQRIHRTNLGNYNLMQSLVMANTKFVTTHVGRFLLCGADHVFAKPVDIMFEGEDFDIGIMYFDQRVNNTAVLVDTSRTKKHGLVTDFFRLRERLYHRLPNDQKSWDGDQVTLRMALTEWGFPTLHPIHLVNRVFESNGLRVKFWWYDKRWVGGARKFKPRYDPDWRMIDFKGAQRKQWFWPVYEEVMNAARRVTAGAAGSAPRRGVALSGPWVSSNPLPALPNFEHRTMAEVQGMPSPDFWVIWNNVTNNRNSACPDAYDIIRQSKRPWIVGEVPIFRAKDAVDRQDRYYRWSWLSYFYNSGVHFHDESPRHRWLSLQQDLKITVCPWQPRGDNILFVMQKPRDNSMQALRLHWGSFENFMTETIYSIKKYSNRPIVVRLHPNNHAQQMNYLAPVLERFPDLRISEHSLEDDVNWHQGHGGLERDLDQAWAVVGGNSNVLVESACHGVPTYCLHETAMAWPVSQAGLHMLEQPDLNISRTQWLWNMAYTQWRHDEVIMGLPWQHLAGLYDRAVAKLNDPFIKGAYWPNISRKHGGFDAKR